MKDQREAFEAWKFKRYEYKEFSMNELDYMFEAYQAALASLNEMKPSQAQQDHIPDVGKMVQVQKEPESKLKNIADAYMHELILMSDEDILDGLKQGETKKCGLAMLDAAKQNIWISVEFMLPEIATPVLGLVGKNVYALARIEYDEGWLWAIGESDLSDIRNYEADDDYQPTHWMPLPPAPEGE